MDPISHGDPGFSIASYFRLVDQGILTPEDHVELLEGVIVAEPPQEPRHANATTRIAEALGHLAGGAAVVRVQMPLVLGDRSAPEPDVALVPGPIDAYENEHPQRALLVVEVASTSLPKDRLSKSRIYAAAEIPDYWIVNLRDEQVEVLSDPDADRHCYRRTTIVRRGDRLALTAFPGASIAVAGILPSAAN